MQLDEFYLQFTLDNLLTTSLLYLISTELNLVLHLSKTEYVLKIHCKYYKTIKFSYSELWKHGQRLPIITKYDGRISIAKYGPLNLK